MNIEVRYHSRGGNTKKVAEAIAGAAGTSAMDCSFPIKAPVDLLFLGASVYGFGLDEAIKDFIAKIHAVDVRQVALFGTSAMVKTGNEEMAKLLRANGISVLEQNFYCRGAFAMAHRGHPNAEDLKKAADFARLAIEDTSANCKK